MSSKGMLDDSTIKDCLIVPDGFVLVPVRPTHKMKRADGAFQGTAFWIRWEAILAAATTGGQP